MVFAEYFDIFGLATFAFLFVVGAWMMKKNRVPPEWVMYILMLIGILGFVVDGYIVINTFLIGG